MLHHSLYSLAKMYRILHFLFQSMMNKTFFFFDVQIRNSFKALIAVQVVGRIGSRARRGLGDHPFEYCVCFWWLLVLLTALWSGTPSQCH